MRKSIILFDIDHTLFNGETYRKHWFTAMAKKAEADDEEAFITAAGEIYFEMRKTGPFLPTDYTQMLVDRLRLPVSPKDLEKVMYEEEILRAALFEETIEVLEILSKEEKLILGIFSTGPKELQKAKIKAIEQYFPNEHTHIFLQKETELWNILRKYKDKKIYLIDDLLPILHQANSIDKDVYTIWIKRGWIAKKQKPIEGFKPDKTIDNLREVLKIIND